MNILVITGRIPYPVYFGTTIRVYHPFKILSERHTISLFCFVDSEDQLAYFPEIEGIFSSLSYLRKESNERRSFSGRLLNILTMNPSFIIEKQYPDLFRKILEKLKQIIAHENIDIVYSHTQGLAQYTYRLHDIPKVLDLVDSESLYLKRELQHTKFSFSKEYVRKYVDYIRTRTLESKVPRFHNVTTLVSPKDADVIRALCPGSKIEVIPNGVDIRYFSPLRNCEEDTPSIIFHGHMSYPPNVDAVLFFYQEVLPRVREEIPNLKMFVVGKNPSDEVRKLSIDKLVRVTGFVDDIRPFIGRSTIAVFPLRIGGGFRNKIAEAMAMAKAVVTTSIGTEALNARPGKHLMIADRPKEFSEKVIELVRQEELRQEMGESARRLIVEEYSWDKVANEYESLYTRLVSEGCT